MIFLLDISFFKTIYCLTDSIIVATRLPKSYLLSESTVRRKVKQLYAKNSESHADVVSELEVLGYDERGDMTKQANGKEVKESHITITDERDYVDHGTVPKPHTALNAFKQVWDVVEKTGSEQSIKWILCDGCNTNTGCESKSLK